MMPIVYFHMMVMVKPVLLLMKVGRGREVLDQCVLMVVISNLPDQFVPIMKIFVKQVLDIIVIIIIIIIWNETIHFHQL